MLSLGLLMSGACTAGKRHAPRTAIERRMPAPGSAARPMASRPLPAGPSLTELRLAAADPDAAAQTARRVSDAVRRPAVSNAAWRAGRRPGIATNASLGPFLRIASWNIEKSFRVREAVEGWHRKQPSGVC